MLEASGDTKWAEKGARLFDGALVGILIVSCLIFYWLSTHGTWDPLYEPQSSSHPFHFDKGYFFLAQAQAMIHGRLWVKPWELPGECWIRNGRCYGYFGLTPSLLRLPLLPVLDHYNRGLTPAYITAALALATGSFLAALRHLFSRMRLAQSTLMLVALVGLSFGAAGVLTQLTPASLYDEAIAWAVGFLSLSVYCFIRWWENQQLRWYALLLASLFLAANARPTAVPFAFIIGLGVGYKLWSVRGDGTWAWAKALSLGGALIVIPLATCLGVYYVKLGQLIPSYLLNQTIGGLPAFPPWLTIREIDHDELVSWRFVPTALFAYLRPDSVNFTRTSPWVGFRFSDYLAFGRAPIAYVQLRRGSLYAETVSSLTVTMPLALVVFACAAFGVVTSRMKRMGQGSARQLLRSHVLRSRHLWKVIALMAAVASWCVVLTGIDVSNRFLGDAYPLLALFLLLGLPRLARVVDRGGRVLKTGAIAIVVCGVSWQLFVNIALAWRYGSG